MSPITIESNHNKDGKRVRRGSRSGEARLSKRAKTETTTTTAVVLEPRDQDVLFGRGGLSNKHPGNHVYRRVVKMNKDAYRSCAKREKSLLAMSIVLAIKGQSTPGRFLRLHKEGGYWCEVDMSDALEKTFQALREQDAEDKANGPGPVVPKSHVRKPFSNPFKTIVSSSSENIIPSSSESIIPENNKSINTKQDMIAGPTAVESNNVDQLDHFDFAPLSMDAVIPDDDDALMDMFRDILEDPATDNASVTSDSTHASGDASFCDAADMCPPPLSFPERALSIDFIPLPLDGVLMRQNSLFMQPEDQ